MSIDLKDVFNYPVDVDDIDVEVLSEESYVAFIKSFDFIFRKMKEWINFRAKLYGENISKNIIDIEFGRYVCYFKTEFPACSRGCCGSEQEYYQMPLDFVLGKENFSVEYIAEQIRLKEEAEEKQRQKEIEQEKLRQKQAEEAEKKEYERLKNKYGS